MRLVWSEEFSVKVETLDKQHQQLFQILARLRDAMDQGRDKRELVLILGDFVFYTDRHFYTEEAFLRRNNFPFLDEHIMDHDRARKYVNDMKKEYNDGNYLVTLELADYIENWICQHILIEDKKYAGLSEEV